MTRKAESETLLTSSANTQGVQYSLQGKMLERKKEAPYLFNGDKDERNKSLNQQSNRITNCSKSFKQHIENGSAKVG